MRSPVPTPPRSPRTRIPHAIGRFLRDDDGPTAAEYAVLLALLVGSLIAIITATGNIAADWWTSNTDAITSATAPGSSGGGRAP